MTEPVHIDNLIRHGPYPRRVQRAIDLCENTANAGSVADLAYESVRDGEIVTDADIKIDQLYRALSSISFDQYCEFCSTLTDEGPHNEGCLFVEAVEYVAKNWEATDER